MSRSQRRAAVIRGSIAAGVLCAVVGLTAVAPAAADTGDDDGSPGASNHHWHGDDDSKDTDGAGRGNGIAPIRRGVRTSLEQNPGWHPYPHPCPCHQICPPPPVPAPLPVLVGRNRNAFISSLYSQPTPPAPPVTSLGARAVDFSTGLLGVVAAPVVAPPAAAGPAEAPSSGPAGPAASLSAAPAALPLISPAPASVPPNLPETVAGTTNPASAGLPAVPRADLGRIAAVALPGLAGIAALTALGGFLGYRQAKAGYVLRTAGTARFLQ